MIRDENNKQPTGGDRTRRPTGGTARGLSPNGQKKRPAGSSRAQRLADLENRGASGGSSQRGLPPGYDRPPAQSSEPLGQNRPSAYDWPFGQSGSSAYRKPSTQGARPSAQGNRPAARNRPSGQRRAAAQSRPSPGKPILQGSNQRDFDREAARRRIEERRRKLEAKQKRQIEKKQRKHKNIRGRKRRRAKRIRALATVLAVFAVFFIVWPHLTDRVGEKNDAEPASATQQQEAGQETKKQESQMETNARNTSSEYLILVNKTHALKPDYEPGDLVDGKPAVSGGSAYQQMRKPAAAAFKKLAADAKEEGHTIKITSGYRPYAYQKQIFERYVNKDGRYSAEQYSAEPGHSEHQTGLVADVSSPSVNYNLVQAYGATQEGAWLAKNAHKYGFIIRFPKGKEEITGYKYEPWHIRYVGKDAAKEIHKQKLTLEEYLEQE